MNLNQLLTEVQAALLAKVQPKTIADWGRAGKLPRVKLSARCIRYRSEDVQALIENCLEAAKSAQGSQSTISTQ